MESPGNEGDPYLAAGQMVVFFDQGQPCPVSGFTITLKCAEGALKSCEIRETLDNTALANRFVNRAA
jgi:hypothetical protein